jgi:nucleoside 2-deoxyribosyltransferase
MPTHYEPMKVIYVAGPIRAKGSFWKREQNIRAAEEVALQLWKMGFAVICPHTMCRYYDDMNPREAGFYLRGDLELIKRSDAIMLLDDWEESEGSVDEHSFAIKEGMLIFYGLDDFRTFLEYQGTDWK